MLRSLKEFEGYKVTATDGDVGKVVNFLLDDEKWAVRYLVVETGGFFGERRVLISPISFRQADFSTKRFHLSLTMEKVKNSPGVDADKPVSRQHEMEYYRYYGYPQYWGSAGSWGMGGYPVVLTAGGFNEALAENSTQSGDVHLRSAEEVRGYQIQGNNDRIGHVADFIVDDESWGVRYLVVDTSNWWFGKKVLVSPHWATRVSWGERLVYVDMPREAIKSSPEWDPSAPVNREYETRLYDYYGRPVYWSEEDQKAAEASMKPIAEPSRMKGPGSTHATT